MPGLMCQVKTIKCKLCRFMVHFNFYLGPGVFFSFCSWFFCLYFVGICLNVCNEICRLFSSKVSFSILFVSFARPEVCGCKGNKAE